MTKELTFKIVTGDEAMECVTRFATVVRSGCGRREAKESFLQFLARYDIDASRQAAAFLGNKIVGYVLCLVNPGATAGVFLPEAFPDLGSGYDYAAVAAQILRCLVSQMVPWDVAILQAMVMDENSAAARIYRAGGFSLLCRLKIMDAGVGVAAPEEPIEEVRWLTFDRIPEERFADLILQTYEASRDCPCLTGLRSGQEILAGHRSSGIFEPDGWAILRFRDRDAGVLLLNNTEEDPQRMELVYMGLAPWARGANLGGCLMNRAFEIARQKGKNSIRLAVDCGNGPAIRLYHRFGFQEISRQVILAVLNESRRNTKGNYGR